MEAIGFIGGTITSLGGIPQIYKIVTTKKVDDLSWIMLGAWFVGLSMTLVYAFSIHAVPICVNAIISLTNTTIILGLKVYFGKTLEYEALHPMPSV